MYVLSEMGHVSYPYNLDIWYLSLILVRFTQPCDVFPYFTLLIYRDLAMMPVTLLHYLLIYHVTM